MTYRASHSLQENGHRKSVIVSDSPDVDARIKAALTKHFWPCESDVISTSAAPHLLGASDHDLVICVLPPQGVDCVSLLQGVRTRKPRYVIAAGQADAPTILHALHDGAADEFVDLEHLDEELGGVLDRLDPQERGKIISVLSSGGGSGGSTVAANLAVAFASWHSPGLLLDLSTVDGVQACLLDLTPENTVADLCQNVSRLDKEMFGQFLVKHDSGLEVLPGVKGPEEGGRITTDGISRALDLAQILYPLCIVDADSHALLPQLELFQRSDLLLLVVEPSVVGVTHTRRVLDLLGREGVSTQRLQLLVNGVGTPQQLTLRQVEESLPGHKLAFLPYDPKHVNHARNVGLSVVKVAPRSPFSRKLRTLVTQWQRRVFEESETSSAPPVKGRFWS